MIKNYNNFVTEQFDDFYNDLAISKKKLKLFTKFKKIKTDDVKTTFTLPQPKKRFQPKIKQYKKINNDKGIF
jgi:hypothetical protein|tara:strand:+ start:461 stop:676 length:216 start_codon:yes stop_codon:yes gene_type:complete